MHPDGHKNCPKCNLDLQELAYTQLPFCPRCQFPVRLIADRYRIDTKLAAGGFGVVYLAWDLERQDKAVVKLIKRELFETPAMGVRFQREIRVTEQLSARTEHIVRYLGHGEEENLGHYYVMEYLDGITLEKFLRDTTELPFTDSFHIFGQLCKALHEAHSQGIVHRDLKPENIFLVERHGDPLFVKVLDFGIAKSLEGTAHASLTKGVIGTPTYLSPEQCLNQNVDGRSDIYAMGVILYELLTRTVVFDFAGDAMMAIMYKHMNEMPIPMRTRRPDIRIPKELDEAVLKALAKYPGERYATVEEFWQALLPFTNLPCVATNIGGELQASEPSAKQDVSAAFEPTMMASSDKPAIRSRKEATLPTGTHTPSPPPRGTVDLHSGGARSATPSPRKLPLPRQATRPEFLEPTSRRALPLWAVIVLVSVAGAAALRFWKNQLFPTQQNNNTVNAQLPGAHRAVNAPLRRLQLPLPRPEAPPADASAAGDDDAQPPPRLQPLVKPRPRYVRRTRPRRVRHRRRHRPRRVAKVSPRHRNAAAKKVGPCPADTDNTYYVWGRLRKPSKGRATIRIYGCSGCVIRRRGGYCLKIPRSKTSFRLRIKVEGYATCKHRWGVERRTIQWALKEYDPDALINETYQCY